MREDGAFPHGEVKHAPPVLEQTQIGVGVFVTGGLLAVGALTIPGEAGYQGVGPNFLPWLVTAVLLVCGAWMVFEARTGGFRHAEEASGATTGDWKGFAWMSAGLLANAAMITTLGFILSCALSFVLAVRGLRQSEGADAGSLTRVLRDAGIGLAIAAPVYWMFTKLLAINLPGLTSTGWI